jgi:hypothetical protein
VFVSGKDDMSIALGFTGTRNLLRYILFAVLKRKIEGVFYRLKIKYGDYQCSFKLRIFDRFFGKVLA